MEIDSNVRESWQSDEETSNRTSISKPQRARLRIVDSDSENEAHSSLKGEIFTSNDVHEHIPEGPSQIEGDDERHRTVNRTKKVRAILDSSDDEDGCSSNKESSTVARNAGRRTEDSSSDSSLSRDSTGSRKSSHRATKRGVKLTQKLRSVLNSSDDEEPDDLFKKSVKSQDGVTGSSEAPFSGIRTESPSNNESSWKSMLKGDFYSYGGSSEDEGNTYGELERSSQTNGDATPKAKAVSRKKKSNTTSKKRMEEEARLVHSETQRMTREATVSLPYHKPKQRSLTDFLNRKRTVVAGDIKPKSKEFEHITNTFLEREKEAEELFKSDSEDSDKDPDFKASTSGPQQNADSIRLDNPDPEKNPESTVAINDHVSISKPSDAPDKFQDTVDGITPTDSFPFVNEVSTLELSRVRENDVPNQVNSETFDLKLDDEEEEPPVKPNLAPKTAQVVPPSIAKLRLQGKPGELISFEASASTKKADPSQLNELVSRFMKHAARKTSSPEKKDIKLNIVKKVVDSTGKEELQSEVVVLKAKPGVEKNPGVDTPPGATMKLLKDSLKSAISAKRQAERQKKLQTQAEDHEDLADEGKDENADEDDFNEEILSDEPDTEEEEGDDMEEDIHGDSKESDKSTDKQGYQSSAENEDGGTEEVNDRLEEKDDDENQDNESLANTTGDKFNLSSSPNLDRSLPDNPNKLAAEPEISTQDNMDELVGLCSANFETQKEVSRSLFGKESTSTGLGKSFSRIVDMEDDDPAESQDTEETWRSLVAADDDPEAGQQSGLLDEEDGGGITARKKKPKTRLCFSDDEEGDEQKEEDVDEADEEENEELTEFRRATEYFEDEAELSGSDAGSGDEREDANDYWEREEGDDETFDEDELRKQVERAHLKTLLDQDQRDVRLMQELFLEDGDLHSDGGGRLRQFRWRNTQQEENEENPVTQSDAEEEEAAENEGEAAWRKLRHEREKWLSEQQSQTVGVSTVTERTKITWVSSTKAATVSSARQTVEGAAPNSTIPDSPQKVQTSLNGKRGSFLKRAEKDLMVIANLAKSSLPIQGAASANNFVFASLTPDRTVKVKQAKKRPMDSSGPAAKKPKANDKTSIFSFL